jgi:putative Mn2+ efflux pump MntP
MVVADSIGIIIGNVLTAWLPLAVSSAVLFVLVAAALLTAPILGRPGASKQLRRLGQHRLQIAGGLVLIGIALKTLIEHLA